MFENSPHDLESVKYISEQPEWQQYQLELFVNELLISGKIEHPDARKLDHNRWSLWVRAKNSDAINHICYFARADEPILSDFERELMNPKLNHKSQMKVTSKSLVIMNEDKTAISIGRADEYLDPEYYASLMDSIKRDIFLKTIEDIYIGKKSEDYSVGSDGIIKIHINKSKVGYGVHIECLAKWLKV